MREAMNYAPADGSKAALERRDDEPKLRGDWGQEQVTASHSWGWFLVGAAEAHLNSIYDLLGLDRGVVYSDQVLARAAVEHMARSSWLSDPSIDARERLARWETERLYSGAEAAKLGF